MIETTTSALTKWCPMVRQVWCKVEDDAFITHGETPAFNVAHEELGSYEHRCPCVANRCMMWQSLGTLQVEGNPASDLGYCGMAGRPMLPGERAEIIAALQAKPGDTPAREAA